MSLVAYAFLLGVSATPPAPVAVSTEESALLQSGGVVVRYGGDRAQTVAMVDVRATPERVMAAVMDLPARVQDIGALSGVETYNAVGDDISAKWTMNISMVSVVFHIQYDCEMAKYYCLYTLDSTKPNDIESSNGSYQAYAIESGSRLVYRTDSMAAGAPEWLRKRLASSSATEMLLGMKARAEK